MALDKTQLKFTKSETTGDLIGFVSQHPKTKKLLGVREDSRYGKKICVLSKDLTDHIEPNVLYDVELKAMHSFNGFVVVSATLVLFKAQIETIVVPKAVYQVVVTFGNKTVYYDPKDGKSPSSRTIEGVVNLLEKRKDIEAKDGVIADFKKQAEQLRRRADADGFITL